MDGSEHGHPRAEEEERAHRHTGHRREYESLPAPRISAAYEGRGASPVVPMSEQVELEEKDRLAGRVLHGLYEGSHPAHHAHRVQDFRRRFWISLAATVPVLILSPMIQHRLGFAVAFPGDRWILFLLSSFVFFCGGWPFLKGPGSEVKDRLPGMMTLIALAITVVYVYSSLVVFGLRGEIFYWELATLIDIMLLGHWIEMRSVMGASKALEELARLLPGEAHRIEEDGTVVDVSPDQLQEGQRVLVRPGEKVPADGRILEGESEIDESMITGESAPVARGPNRSVVGGSVNGAGALAVEVTRTGEDSYLSQVVRLVEETGASESRAQGLADKAAFLLTVIAIVIGGGTLVAWLLLGARFAFALERMVTVMVIACPHALGLAAPLVVAMITALSARNGLLIRERIPFENARNVDTVVFDKTGTLTRGRFGVTDIVSFGDWSRDELLGKAATIEQNSEHMIAKGVLREAQDRRLSLGRVRDFTSFPGKGVRGIVDGQEIFVGNTWILDESEAETGQISAQVYQVASQGKTIVLVVSGGKAQGLIAMADMIRDESWEAIRRLKDLGLEIAMITGDNEATAHFVAEQLGLDRYFAEVLPDRKSEKVRDLQDQGKKVAMVGDGVNDAPALAQADVGIAIGAGTDVAIETADVILVENDPRDVADVISLSRIANRKMRQNLIWATAYNVVAIPLAAGVFHRYGIVLPPAVGALVMSLSVVVVAINARLIRFSKRREPTSAGAERSRKREASRQDPRRL